jgi:hypothetical protein
MALGALNRYVVQVGRNRGLLLGQHSCLGRPGKEESRWLAPKPPWHSTAPPAWPMQGQHSFQLAPDTTKSTRSSWQAGRQASKQTHAGKRPLHAGVAGFMQAGSKSMQAWGRSMEARGNFMQVRGRSILQAKGKTMQARGNRGCAPVWSCQTPSPRTPPPHRAGPAPAPAPPGWLLQAACRQEWEQSA